MKIYLVTGNPKKVEIAKFALAKYKIDVEQLDMDTPEIQSSETEEVAKYSVKYAAEETGKTVIKGDFGMGIDVLNGFPGPFVKYINKWLSAEQFSSLYKDRNDLKAYFIDALGYCEPGKEAICFTTITYGELTEKPAGDNGNMVDSLFIPNGFSKTIAQLSKEETLKLWANDRYDQLAKYLSSR
ncbi:non-canonical purine NTP pyrophosphatase [Candidatus Woesebacteria bacterium]|nr:non-canonical purine NTP pyrophosphatase [Candidatus Woesebacteria bacterium]